jgi:hypothetical protein
VFNHPNIHNVAPHGDIYQKLCNSPADGNAIFLERACYQSPSSLWKFRLAFKSLLPPNPSSVQSAELGFGGTFQRKISIKGTSAKFLPLVQFGF